MSDQWEPMDASASGSNYIDEEGLYTVVISKIEKTYSANKGTLTAKLTLRTADGKGIIDNLYITDGSKWRMSQVGKAAGLSDEQLKAFVPTMLQDKVVDIIVEPDPDNLKYMKVVSFRTPSTEMNVNDLPPLPAKSNGDVPF